MATKRKAGRKKKKQQTPGWVWLFAGLSIGLAIAAAVYIQDRGGAAAIVKSAGKPVSKSKTEAPAKQKKDPYDFTFYRDLPNSEIIIPEEDLDARRDAPAREVQAPGTYILQAGSFSNYKDADSMKAKLALMGLIAHIQKVSVDSRNYHRVRIGPITSLSELNRNRAQLHEAGIQTMIIRVGD